MTTPTLVLEQELASIMNFCYENSGKPAVYYYKMPEDFAVPSLYFPTPEITTIGETFLTYAIDYMWIINCFHTHSELAYALGFDILTSLKVHRNLIPLLDETGKGTGQGLRLNDPSLKVVDTGAAQLTLTWRSRRPYYSQESTMMQEFVANSQVITSSAQEALELAYQHQLSMYQHPIITGGDFNE